MYRIAKYLRISLDDVDAGESTSILGQRALIDSHVKARPELSESETQEFVDDGCSGMNFERPGFQSMMVKVKRGEINCIIVKDMSRFGRNYIEVSRYMEQIFPLMDVRFIAINDGFDSENYKGTTAGLEVPFQNLINEMYSKDISKKVTSAKRTKMMRGDCISAYAIYGYVKDAKNINSLHIDEVAAVNIRRAFDMSCEGMTPREIAIVFNGEGVLTPALYKKDEGQRRNWCSTHEENFWTAAAIRRILMDRRYMGDYVGGQWKTTKMGSRKSVKVKSDDWIVLEGKLPAIVSSEVFAKSSELIAERATSSVRGKNALLARKVFCGHCGYTMGRKDSKSHYFFCRTLVYSDVYGCQAAHLSESALMENLITSIRAQIHLACEVKSLWKVMTDKYKATLARVQEDEIRITGCIEQLEHRKMSLYQQYRTDKWTRQRYIAERDLLAKEVSDQENALLATKQLVKQARDTLSDLEHNSFIDAFAKYAGIEQLDKAVVDELVERIDIFDEKHIKITIRGADEFQRLISRLEEEKNKKIA